MNKAKAGSPAAGCAVDEKEKLVLLGLTGHEAVVYGALLRVERVRVSEVAGLASLPRQHVHTALRRLVDRGLAVAHKSRVWSYSAVPPRTAFRDVLSDDRAAMKARAAAIRELAGTFRQRKLSSEPTEVLEVIKSGRAALDEQIRRLRAARQEVLQFYCYEGKGTDQEDIDELDRIEFAQLRRGVKVRCVYERAALESAANRRRFARVIERGEQARVTDKLPMGIQIVDRRTAVFILSRFQQGGIGFFVNDPELVAMLRAGFEYHWQQGEEIGRYLNKPGKGGAR